MVVLVPGVKDMAVLPTIYPETEENGSPGVGESLNLT